MDIETSFYLPIGPVLLISGLITALGIWLQRRRFRHLAQETNFYGKSRTAGRWVRFHLFEAPPAMFTYLVIRPLKFGIKNHGPTGANYRMPLTLLLSKYWIHFVVFDLFLFGALLLHAVHGVELPPIWATAPALVVVGYLFYWKWLFSSFLLCFSLALQFLSWCVHGVLSPLELMIRIFSIAFVDSAFSENLALTYTIIVAVVVAVTTALDIPGGTDGF